MSCHTYHVFRYKNDEIGNHQTGDRQRQSNFRSVFNLKMSVDRQAHCWCFSYHQNKVFFNQECVTFRTLLFISWCIYIVCWGLNLLHSTLCQIHQKYDIQYNISWSSYSAIIFVMYNQILVNHGIVVGVFIMQSNI